MKKLTKTEALVWRMWVDGKRHDVIAEKLKISKGTSYVHLCNAKRKLERQLYGC